jgi:hypothetical protein
LSIVSMDERVMPRSAANVLIEGTHTIPCMYVHNIFNATDALFNQLPVFESAGPSKAAAIALALQNPRRTGDCTRHRRRCNTR